jgi:hypothetical protein
MGGIFINNEFCEDSDLICKRCNSILWEVESRGNFCLTCNKFIDDSETEIQEELLLPPVAIAFYDNEYKYLKDKEGNIMIFENQIDAEFSLLYCDVEPEDFYFIDIDHLNNIMVNFDAK